MINAHFAEYDMPVRIALTGAAGFVGHAILSAATQRDTHVVPLLRSPPTTDAPWLGKARTPRVIGVLGSDAVDPTVLAECTAVIHAAAKAHRMGEHGPIALASYRRCNVAGTQALIAAMAVAGVRRLVYVSSIKALGERSSARPLHPGDERHPEDPYGISKAEAEDAVLAAHDAGTIDAVIVRPVLVHGSGAKGNLHCLMSALHRGRPLPLGAVHNRRSLIGADNLADALLTAATRAASQAEVRTPDRPRPAPTRPVYHLADDGTISTRRLVEVLAEGMGVRPRLICIPRWLVVGGATLLGKGAVARRLFDDLVVDDGDFRRDFAWKPSLGLEDGLRQMGEDFARRMRNGDVPS